MKIPLAAIVITDRQRKDYQNLDALAESLKTYGLLQPILINQRNELIAGGRRVEAARLLGWSEIDCVNRDTASEIDLKSLEYEENAMRAGLTWQENVCAVADIHQRRAIAAIAAGTHDDWGYEKTGELLGVSRSNVAYCVTIAKLIKEADAEVVACANVTDAIRLLTERKLKDASSILAKSLVKPTLAEAPPIEAVAAGTHTDDFEVIGDENCVACGGKGLNSKGGPCICAKLKVKDDVLDDLPGMPPPGRCDAYMCDAIEWLKAKPAGSIQCIYTDPPYGIDMDMLNQDNNSGNVSLVVDTHKVHDNLSLLAQLMHELGRVLDGIAVLWCDTVNWQFLVNAAESNGLRVQRWPLIWAKPHPCKNGSPYSNFCKSTEIAMLVATPGATLAKVCTKNWWTIPQDSSLFEGLTNPFWKPIALHQAIIPVIAAAGTTVVDLFAGCGSIPLAAMRLGYHAVAIECDPVHYTKLIEICKPSNCYSAATSTSPATSPTTTS